MKPQTQSLASESKGAAASATLTARQRFAAACSCRPVDRPPVWLMRQAGRALPEYRELRGRYSFLELVQTPELAVEVTLQPIRRFGFDAAIVFSDILVIPEAMGQPYRFRDTGGVVMDFAIQGPDDIRRLSTDKVVERLSYVDKALRLLRRELGDETALIGFSGSPWTLATFMMEGGSVGSYTRALTLFRQDRGVFNSLMEKLTEAIIGYLRMQSAAGVDALQVFDSHGGLLEMEEFQEGSGRWIKDVIAGVSAAGSDPGRPRPPVIVFSLGTHSNWGDLVGTGADVLGIDARFSLAEARRSVPANVALQGNLDPALLRDGSPEDVAVRTSGLLVEMRDRAGYILNLGHGLPPGAKLENIQALVDTVKRHS